MAARKGAPICDEGVFDKMRGQLVKSNQTDESQVCELTHPQSGETAQD